MMKTSTSLLALAVLFALTSPAMGIAPTADTPAPVAAGKVSDISSTDGETTVDIRRGTELKNLGVGAPLYVGDTVMTGATTIASLLLNEDTRIVVGPGSEFAVNSVTGADGAKSTFLKVSVGLIRLWVKHIYTGDQTFQVSAGNSVMGVRGTNFVIDQENKTDTNLFTIDGKVAIATSAAGLSDTKTVVFVEAGYTSSLTGKMTEPATPKPYKREELQARLEKRAPGFGKAFLDGMLKADGDGARGVDYGIKKPKTAPAKSRH